MDPVGAGAGWRRSPADAWVSLLRRLARRWCGRRVQVAGATFTLTDLDLRPDGSTWSMGRLRDVRVTTTDVVVDGLHATWVVGSCDALTVTAGDGLAATASPVTLTAALSLATVRALLERTESGWEVDLPPDGPRAQWAPGVVVGVDPEVVDGRLQLTANAVHAFGARFDLPWWLPAVTTIEPQLPVGLRLLAVEPGDGEVVVRAVLDEPPAVPLRPVRLRHT